MSQEIINEGTRIRITNHHFKTTQDYIVAQVGPGEALLISLDKGNRFRDEKLIMPISVNDIEKYVNKHAFMGRSFEIIEEKAEERLEPKGPKPTEDNGDRGPSLTAAQRERLYLLIEEAAEVQQIASKALRHGFQSFNPFDKDKVTNRTLIEKELGDLSAAIMLMVENNDIDHIKINKYYEEKRVKVKRFLHHQ